MKRNRSIALVAAFGLAACIANAEEPAKPIAIKNVRIFDGSRVIPKGTVVLRGRTIAAAGRKVAIPAGAEVIDGAGATLMPGLIDSHTHTWADALARAAVFGVTTELDMFTDPSFASAMRAEQAESGAPGRADLFSAGYLATVPGGHGTEYGMPVPTLTRPDEAQAWVDARLGEGSDYIKIVMEDGKPYGMTTPTLDEPTVAALVAAAHRRKKLAVTHVSTEDSAKSALSVGSDGLIHIFSDRAPEPAFVSLAAKRKAFVTPTLTVVESTTGTASGGSLVDDSRLAPYLTDEEIQNLRRSFPRRSLIMQHALDAVRQLKKAGVPILAGSDAPNPGTAHGASIHREMELLVAAGLSPAQALAAATSVPAKVFGLKDRGRIAAGLRADLVLVQGDPTADITATRDILRVWKIGREVERPQATRAPVAAVAAPTGATASGAISDFEDGTLKAPFGSWMESTDSIAGGKSVVRYEVVSGGAESERSLAITGEVKAGFAYPWAGAFFSPGPQIMAPADLSRFSGISFWAKGENGPYQLMVFATRLGRMPATAAFAAGPEWKRYTYRFADFGLDGSDIAGIFWGAGPAPGAFSLQIDGVRLEP
jgi:imidazolonepropionase-like amidohydrolase